MQRDEATEADTPAGMTPHWRVTRVVAKPGFKLDVSFVDGTSGAVQLEELLESNMAKGTVFEPLRDEGLFAQVGIEMGAVTWPNGADLAPDAMYDAIKARGYWRIEP